MTDASQRFGPGESVQAIADESGVVKQTLYIWKKYLILVTYSVVWITVCYKFVNGLVITMKSLRLEQLGWYGFQQLVLTICQEVLGQTVQVFLDTNDGGRDGAFTGQWHPKKNEYYQGEFVIQCKCKEKVGNLHYSDVVDEIEKAHRLASKGKCDIYLLITNAGISGRTEETIQSELKKGIKNVLIYGSSWIEKQIRENKRLRMLIPRVYGIGDLGQILDEWAYI